MDKELAENEDYYFDDHNNMVFTAKYLLNRGTCCGNGCRHCPYQYINVPEPEEGSAKLPGQNFLKKPL